MCSVAIMVSTFGPRTVYVLLLEWGLRTCILLVCRCSWFTSVVTDATCLPKWLTWTPLAALGACVLFHPVHPRGCKSKAPSDSEVRVCGCACTAVEAMSGRGLAEWAWLCDVE